MTKAQEAHLNRLKQKFNDEVDSKYRKGQAEHGGDLTSKTALQLLDMAIEETIDQFVYLSTLRENISGI